jgi:hypothetical protein
MRVSRTSWPPSQRRNLRYREKALADAIDEFQRVQGVTGFVKDRLAAVTRRMV